MADEEVPLDVLEQVEPKVDPKTCGPKIIHVDPKWTQKIQRYHVTT